MQLIWTEHRQRVENLFSSTDRVGAPRASSVRFCLDVDPRFPSEDLEYHISEEAAQEDDKSYNFVKALGNMSVDCKTGHLTQLFSQCTYSTYSTWIPGLEPNFQLVRRKLAMALRAPSC